MSESNSDVAVRAFSDEELRSIKSFDDLRNMVADKHIPTVNAADFIGDGFELIENKGTLVGVPFVIVDHRFSKSDKIMRNGEPTEFVTLRLVTQDNRKLIINDGSTGIAEQVRQLPDAGVVFVPRGLRVSEYDYTDEKGNTTEAQTYYLAV